MRYRFLCTEEGCAAVTERVIPMREFQDETTCAFCGQLAKHIFEGAPAVSTANMNHQPFDVAIGRDAATRWAAIEERQQKRDKIRKETGSVGLVQTGDNDFAPITATQQKRRTIISDTAIRTGFNAQYDSLSENTLMKR